MICAKCVQSTTADTTDCPHCTGDRKTTDRQVIQGGIRGAAIGLFIGLLPAALLLFFFGAERGIKGIAFIVPAVTFTTGLIFGLVKAKKEWK